MSYNLTHTGSQIDEAIDKVFGIDSSAEEINEAIRSIDDKVDKEKGKGLSSNDYTNEEKNKLNGKQDALTLTVKANGNIVIGNIEGQTKEFMPATPSGDPMHYYYLSHFGVTYNAATGFFELEYLKDLTANDMRNAVRVSGDWRHMYNVRSSIDQSGVEAARPRTNIAIISGEIPVEKYRHPQWQTRLEQFIIGKCNNNYISTLTGIWNSGSGLVFTFAGLANLRFIVGNIDLSTLGEYFLANFLGNKNNGAIKLEEVRFTNLKTSQRIIYQTNLSKQSIQFLLENRTNKAEISLGLPAVIYNKIMKGGEWDDLLTLCAASGDKGAVILEQNA